jgi:hypothetical protein
MEYGKDDFLKSFVFFVCHMLEERVGYWADIQRQGSILVWIVILSVYGADTIAEVKLLISPFLR